VAGERPGMEIVPEESADGTEAVLLDDWSDPGLLQAFDDERLYFFSRHELVELEA
jgi:hypothetical protein